MENKSKNGYTVSTIDVTPYTCHELLSILDAHKIDTSWIRLTWNSDGISNAWCANRCVELINRYDIDLPDNLYGVTYNPISSYYNTSDETVPTNTGKKYF